MKTFATLMMLALPTLGLAACSPGGSSGGAQGGPVPVSVQTPTVKEVTLWDEFIGRFEAVERVEIRPRVSGYLDEVHFTDGTDVEKGQLLFTIDQRPFQAALDGAKARAEAARTRAQLAATQLERARNLLSRQVVSQEDFDQRVQEKKAADAEVVAAEAAVREAELDLEFTSIVAPIGGRIGEDLVDIGNLVTAQETILTVIVSTDPIHFAFTGSEQDYLRYLRLDQTGKRKSSRFEPNPVRIKLEDQEEFAIEGLMDFVNNEIDQSTGTIEGRAIVQNADGFLTPGMFGRMRLYGQDPFEALMIPDTAVQFDQSRQFVWVVGAENAAEMRPVTLGRLLDGEMRIIEQGLSPDDRVVVSGLMAVRPGVTLAPQPASEDTQTAEATP